MDGLKRMNKAEKQAIAALPVILIVGAAISWAGSQGSGVVNGWPVFALCGLFCFVLNWIVFVHAYATQTERFFDLTGSITYLSVALLALAAADPLDTRKLDRESE